MLMRVPRGVLRGLVVFHLLVGVAHAEPPPRPQVVRLGVIASPASGERSDANSSGSPPEQTAKSAVFQAIRAKVLPYSIEVIALNPDEDPSAVLDERSDLDFVVECMLSGDHPQALIHSAGTDRVTGIEAKGDRAVDELAEKILQYISSPQATKLLITKRAQDAKTPALEESPKELASRLLTLGLAARSQGDSSKAIELIEEAIEANAGSVQSHYALALCFKDIDNAAEKVKHLHRVLELDELHEGASIALGNHYLNNKDYGQAIAHYRKWLDSPKNANLVRWNLALAHNRLAQHLDARLYLVQISRNSPYYVRAQNLLLDLSSPEVSAPQKTSAWLVGLTILLGVLSAGVLLFFSLRRRRVRSVGNDAPTKSLDHLEETQTIGTSAKSLGDYDLIKCIGKGGMGEVYLSRHRHLDRLFAVKVLSSRAVGDSQIVERFRQEMRTAGSLDHPNVVRTTDAGCCDGSYYLVTEYIEGVDLDEYLKREGPLPVEQARRIILEIAQGLQHVHDAGLVHRDIKPSNFMRCGNGDIKLIDFGLARIVRPTSPGECVTQVGQFIGTPEYVAPEIVTGAASIDGRADIYSLGCSYYALLAGQPPFGGPEHATPWATAMAHVKEEPKLIERLRPDLPDELARLVKRMMAKDRDQRIATPREVVDLLRAK